MWVIQKETRKSGKKSEISGRKMEEMLEMQNPISRTKTTVRASDTRSSRTKNIRSGRKGGENADFNKASMGTLRKAGAGAQTGSKTPSGRST